MILIIRNKHFQIHIMVMLLILNVFSINVNPVAKLGFNIFNYIWQRRTINTT